MDERDPSNVLSPYSLAGANKSHPLVAWLYGLILVLFCALYGSVFSLFVPFLFGFLLIPLLVITALVFWTLPVSERAPIRLLEVLFLAFFVVLALWPNYLAVAIPSLPWITVLRSIAVPFVFIFLFCVAVSPDIRKAITTALADSPVMWRMLIAFAILQLLSIGLSNEVSFSLNKFIVAQVNWTSFFFASCYIFLRPGRPVLWAGVFWFLAAFVSAIGLWEHSIRQLPWAGHIPALLKIDDETVQRILSPHERSFTGRYRAQSTFSTPLGLAEYIALSMPFVLNFTNKSYSWFIRAAALVTIPFLVYAVVLTDARAGLIGCLLALLVFGLSWSINRWRQNRTSVFGPAIVLAYPTIIVGAVAATFFVRRFRSLIWGTDASSLASSAGRIDQIVKGIPKILSHPWGYGIAMGGATLDWRTPEGHLTIDNYYLTIALEYGVIGVALFYGMFAVTIFGAVKTAWSAKQTDRDVALLVPLAVALLIFCVIKSVFSQDDNHPIVFMMMGMVVALVFRQQNLDDKISGR